MTRTTAVRPCLYLSKIGEECFGQLPARPAWIDSFCCCYFFPPSRARSILGCNCHSYPQPTYEPTTWCIWFTTPAVLYLDEQQRTSCRNPLSRPHQKLTAASCIAEILNNVPKQNPGHPGKRHLKIWFPKS